ncbi:unnamed protein product [Caenorhabditis auriculariae]|uniref:Uncharacterized protein n=1 Tax=Caenorhabditis auriculariae TaxID=2777116 RepID=A0A8S1HIM0_9PELO|nr:unnamed protein product [Caenorhabditis auriculariae]
MNRIIFLLILTTCNASILETFHENGIEYEAYGEGRLVPESRHCQPYTLDLFEYVNTLNTNEMTEYGREMLKRRIFASFDNICRDFNVSTDTDELPPTVEISLDRLHLRFMDRFELTWNALKFERDLKSLFLEHKINTPFLDIVKQEIVKMSGSGDKMDFSHRSTVFPMKCNVAQMTLETRLCFNISEVPQSGMVYALAHGGEFLQKDEVYAFYEVPEYVLITTEAVLPIDLAKCKVLFGTYIYCFAELDTQCDVRTLSDCPIMAQKTGDDFTLVRRFGTGRIVATTEIEFDLFRNGTKLSVPSQIFTVRVDYNTESNGGDVINHVDLRPHVIEKTQFATLLPETIGVLSSDKLTRLFTTNRRGKNMLSHKHHDQSAWDRVRNFFGL